MAKVPASAPQVHLVWGERPKTFLLLKKPHAPRITAALVEVGLQLQDQQRERDGPPITLVVEPAVYAEITCSEEGDRCYRRLGTTASSSLATWADAAHPAEGVPCRLMEN